MIKCPKCNGRGIRIMETNNIGLCLKCLGKKEINENELNDERFYRNTKSQENNKEAN